MHSTSFDFCPSSAENDNVVIHAFYMLSLWSQGLHLKGVSLASEQVCLDGLRSFKLQSLFISSRGEAKQDGRVDGKYWIFSDLCCLEIHRAIQSCAVSLPFPG